jgi:hypothetical protein
VSHYRVLAELRTLREAVRAAGLEPNPKGEKISTEDLLTDWKRMAKKLEERGISRRALRGSLATTQGPARLGESVGESKNPFAADFADER